MTKEIITVHVRLDAEAFRRFAVFDNLLLRRRWGRPVVFCILMTLFAAVCFWLRREQSALIGSVLLLVGFGMPLVYFGTFFHQIQTQVKKLRLKTPQAFYTLRLGPEGRAHYQRPENRGGAGASVGEGLRRLPGAGKRLSVRHARPRLPLAGRAGGRFAGGTLAAADPPYGGKAAVCRH